MPSATTEMSISSAKVMRTVVDRHAGPAFADAAERLGEPVVILDRLVLGDLDDHPRGIDGVEGSGMPSDFAVRYDALIDSGA